MVGFHVNIRDFYMKLNLIGNEIFMLGKNPWFLEGSEERRAIASFLGSLFCAAHSEIFDLNHNILLKLDYCVWKSLLDAIEDSVLLQETIESLD